MHIRRWKSACDTILNPSVPTPVGFFVWGIVMPDLGLSLSIGGAKTTPHGSPGTLTIGNDGTNFGFSQGAYGAVTPTSIGGLAVNAMAVDQSDLFVIQFAGNAQISGVSSIGIIFPGYVPTLYAVNWNGANTRYQATFAGLTTYFTAQDGNTIPFNYLA